MFKIFKVTALVLLVTLMIWGILFFKAQDNKYAIREVPFFKNSFEIIAYRGGGFEAPENTLPAFKNAVDANPDVILHLNAQITGDNKVVVFFDENLARTTDGEGQLWRKTLDELKKLNAAAKFKNEKGENPFLDKKVQIPSLQEVLAQFPKQRFIIELGQRYRELAFLVYEIIKDQNAFERVLVSAQNNQPLKYLRQMDPRFYLTASQDEVMRMTTLVSLKLIGLDPMKADAYFVPTQYASVPVLTDDFINEIHRRGKKVYVQNINDQSIIEKLKQQQVDGIATDRPKSLIEQLR